MQKSTGIIHWDLSTLEENPNRDNIISATINIVKCANANVTASIFASNEDNQPKYKNSTFFQGIFGDRLLSPRSFTFIYRQQNAPTKNRIISLGERQANDKLLKFESKLIKTKFRFPEDSFEYEDATKSITKITFSFSVSWNWCQKSR